MFIDRSTGYFNTTMDFKKDYAAILSALYDIDVVIRNYIDDPNEITELTLSQLGFELSSDEESSDNVGSVEEYEEFVRKAKTEPDKVKNRLFQERMIDPITADTIWNE